jgi:hypothetical protein
LLICLWTSAIAGNSSSALNAIGSNASAISTSQLPFGINISDLPKSMRNISNHTIQTILASHPKVLHLNFVCDSQWLKLTTMFSGCLDENSKCGSQAQQNSYCGQCDRCEQDGQ